MSREVRALRGNAAAVHRIHLHHKSRRRVDALGLYLAAHLESPGVTNLQEMAGAAVAMVVVAIFLHAQRRSARGLHVRVDERHRPRLVGPLPSRRAVRLFRRLVETGVCEIARAAASEHGLAALHGELHASAGQRRRVCGIVPAVADAPDDRDYLDARCVADALHLGKTRPAVGGPVVPALDAAGEEHAVQVRGFRGLHDARNLPHVLLLREIARDVEPAVLILPGRMAARGTDEQRYGNDAF